MNYIVEKTNGETITVIADNFLYKEDKVLFEAAGAVIQDFHSSSVKSVTPLLESLDNKYGTPLNS